MIKKKIPGILGFMLSVTLATSMLPVRGASADAASVVTDNNVADIVIQDVGTDYDDFDGYIEMPWDDEVPQADPDISFKKAGDILVRDDEWLDRGGDENDFDLPAAWPYSYTDTGSLNNWFDYTLTPLRNQGKEGTCWAHSSISLIEHYLLFHNGSDINGSVKRNVSTLRSGANYSELQLAYFYYHNNENPLISGQTDSVTLTDGESFLAIGGNLGLAGQALMKWRGAVDEALVPYSYSEQFDTAEELSAETGLSEYLAYKQDVVHLTKSYQISIKDNTTQVKQAIKENGVVGVSYHSNRQYYNKEYNSFYNYVDTDTTHAVGIVGWDDDFPAEHFGADGHRPENNGAWLIRNSWMDTLKDPDRNKLCYEGYFWMSYEDTSLKDAAYVYEVGPSGDYDNNYYYTNQMYKAGTITMEKGANVFTVSGLAGADKERLDAVIIQTAKSNVNYSVSIYSVDENGMPLEPIVAGYEPTEGTIVFPGIYTIPLNQTVVLDRGTKYAVVVDTPDQNVLGIEHDMTSSGNYTVSVSANPGESFYYWKGEWKDLAELEANNSGWYGFGNLCIQALTTDIGSIPKKSISNVQVTVRGADTVTLEWTGLTGSVTYNIYRSIGSFEEDSFVKIASNLGLTTYTDKNIPINSLCYYRVVPVISGVEAENRSSRTLATVLKPSYDSSMVATVETKYTGFGGRKAIYGKAAEEADGYIFRYYKLGTSEWIEEEADTITSGGEKYWVYYTDELAPGRYFFIVTPYRFNLYGETVYGADTEEKSFIAYYPGPENLTAKYNKAQQTVNLKWDAVEGAAEYKVFTLSTNDSGTVLHTSLGTTTECSYIHRYVSEGTTYRYAVYVVDRSITDGTFPEEYCWKYATRTELEFYTDSTLPDIMTGDVDGDSEISPKDVTMLRRFLAGGWSVTIIEENADIDHDGEISPKDVTILRRYLAGGWGVTLD